MCVRVRIYNFYYILRRENKSFDQLKHRSVSKATSEQDGEETEADEATEVRRQTTSSSGPCCPQAQAGLAAHGCVSWHSKGSPGSACSPRPFPGGHQAQPAAKMAFTGTTRLSESARGLIRGCLEISFIG